MKKLLNILLGIGVSCLFTSCNSGDNKSNVNELSLKDANFISRMGSGVDSTTNTITSSQSCLIALQNKELPYTITNPHAMIDFSRRTDLSTLEKSLGVDVSGKYGGDRFSVSASANFANGSKDNKYSTNIIYLYKYSGTATFKEGILGESANALTPVAKELITMGDKTEFEQMCGDAFISQMDAGVVLAVKITLKFNSHNDQQKLEAELKGSYGMASIAAAIKHASSSQNVHSDLTLSAFQQGGEPHKLNDIFGKRGNVSNNYPLLDCGDPTKDSNSCNETIDAIIDYAQTLKQQVSGNNGELDLSKLYFSNPVTQSWNSIQVRPYLLHPSPELLQTMEALTTEYDNTVTDYEFAKHYLSSLDGKLTTVAKTALERVVDKLGKQITDIYTSPVYHTMSCYKGYVSNECLNIKKNIDHALSQDKYKLDKLSIDVLKYLKTSAYSIDLYGLKNKVENPLSSDYTVIKGCFLAPISHKTKHQYAINCNGVWLDSAATKPLTVYIDTTDGNLVIENLMYKHAINPFANQLFGMNFAYSLNNSTRMSIPENFELNGVYNTNQFKVYSSPLSTPIIEAIPTNLINDDVELEIINMLDNPA